MSNTVNIQVRATDHSKPAMTAAIRHTDQLGKSTDTAAGKLKLFALGAGAVVGSKLVGFLKSATQGWQDHLKVNAQSEAVIKSTGGAANVTAKEMEDLADSTERKTGVDQDLIQSSENMLATFTNIRNEVGKGNDIFNQATQTVTDMSVALGQDTKNSAIQLGKALNDPIAGISALSRVGVTFTKQQKDQIKALVESGKTMDAQKVILRELGKEFGGSAAAQMTAGDRARVAWNNFKDEVGQRVLPIMQKLQDWIATKLIPAAQSLIDWLTNHTDQVKTFAIGLSGIIAVAGSYKVLNMLTASVQALTAAMKANPWLVLAAALIGVGIWFVQTYKRSEEFRDKVNGVIKNLEHAFSNFMHAVDNVRHAWDNLWHAGENLGHALNNMDHAWNNATHAMDNVEHAGRNVVNFFRAAYLDIKIALLHIGIAAIQYLEIPVLNVFSAIVHGAAAAFGWMPGIGGKLKAARHQFDEFRRGIDKDLANLKLELSTTQAQRNFSAFHRWLMAHATPITIDLYTQHHAGPRPGTYSQNASGGIWRGRHYDSGGIYGDGSIGSINERGGEIVRHPDGSMVYPAGQVPGGAGGPVVVQLQIVGNGGGSEFDRFMLQWIRRNARIVGGGNVQTAFGHG